MSPSNDRPFAEEFLVVAGTASLGAGVIHAAAIAAHSDHRQAVWAFVALAAVQLVWGAAAVARPRPLLALGGVATGAAALGGWILAKRSGISFIDGLDTAEPVRASDALAAAFAGITLLGSGLAFLVRRGLPKFAVGASVAALVAISVPGASGAVEHEHEHDETAADADHAHAEGTPAHDDSAAHDDAAAHADGSHPEGSGAIPPRPYDPNLPIDLGGVEGVTPEQQAAAENVLASTVSLLPRWSDPEYALANGFFSIGDGGTGTEHFLNREFMDDGVMLDPTRPESLVWDVVNGERTLSAAMYMTTPGMTLDDVPEFGGALTQWHIHDNLCFNDQGQVRGLTDGEGNCAPPLVKGEERPMIHVWIRPHDCGPFAALEGVGGGQVREGEPVLCDHAHGS